MNGTPQGQPFDCVLMDLKMPGNWASRGVLAISADFSIVMDGLTAVRLIREEEAAGT